MRLFCISPLSYEISQTLNAAFGGYTSSVICFTNATFPSRGRLFLLKLSSSPGIAGGLFDLKAQKMIPMANAMGIICVDY